MIKKGCGCKQQPKIIEEPSIPQPTWEENTPCIEQNPEVRIENHPDEEDITEVLIGDELVLKFKDKVYNPMVYSGYGRVFLRKNLQNSMDECSSKINVLTQDMFEDENGQLLDNTIFIVQYDYDLQGKFITLPLNSILLFLGGSFVNGTLVMNHTLVLPQALIYDNFIKCSVTGVYKEGQMFYDSTGLRIWTSSKWIYVGKEELSNISGVLTELQEQIDTLVEQLASISTINNTYNQRISAVETSLNNCSPKGHNHTTSEIFDLNNQLNNKVTKGSLLGTINNIEFREGGSISIPTGEGGGGISEIPVASNNTLGGIKIGYTGAGTPVKLDDQNKAYVEVDTSGQIDYSVTQFSIQDRTLSLKQASSNTVKQVQLPAEYSLPQATNSTLGGIKVGATSVPVNGHAVQLNANGQAYVIVPPTGGGGGESESTSYQYVQFMFATVNKGAQPPAIVQGTEVLPAGWYNNASNADATKDVWMTIRTVTVSTTTTYGDWETPWLISGPQGVAGADGENREYIYKLTADYSVSPGDPNSGVTPANAQQDDFVPSGWTDSPSGIDQTHRCEFMSFRVKANGTWSAFSAPVPWAIWGRDGIDGDGVEYIFYGSETEVNFNSPNDYINPRTWSGDTYYQLDEYIRERSGWTDNPPTMTAPGSLIYVSIRKKKVPEGGTDAIWGLYSFPVVWSYIAKDGDNALQSLDYPLIRIRQWVASPNPVWNNGTIHEANHGGIAYTDVVLYQDSYYKCLTAGTTVRPDQDTQGTNWSLFTLSGDAAFDTMLAKSAYIESLTSKQVVVTDGNDDAVGGLIGSNSAEVVGSGVSNNPSDGTGKVILFSGKFKDNNLYTAPFTVTDTGYLKATKAKISGEIMADSLVLTNDSIQNIGVDFDKVASKEYESIEYGINSSWTTPGGTTYTVGNQLPIKYKGLNRRIKVKDDLGDTITLHFSNGLLVGVLGSSQVGMNNNDVQLPTTNDWQSYPTQSYDVTYIDTDGILWTNKPANLYKVLYIFRRPSGVTGEVHIKVTNPSCVSGKVEYINMNSDETFKEFSAIVYAGETANVAAPTVQYIEFSDPMSEPLTNS